MKGRVALITGSGRPRVGRLIANHLADDGYAIALHYHSGSKAAQQAVDEMHAKDVDCSAFQADVANENDVDEMFAAIKATFGRLDVLVTTASVWESVPLEEVTAEHLHHSFGVNVLGTALCAKHAGLQMVTQPEGGAIITIGDWAIQRPYLDHLPYFIAKGAIPTLTQAFAVELAHRNPRVRVNCIHPGPVMFPPDTVESERQALVESTLVKHADDPLAVVQAVKFLIENEFVTGACLPIDGGRSIFASETTSRKRPI